MKNTGLEQTSFQSGIFEKQSFELLFRTVLSITQSSLAYIKYMIHGHKTLEKIFIRVYILHVDIKSFLSALIIDTNTYIYQH